MRKLAIERAARLICPTRAVADDVAALMRVDRERIEVIAEAPADAFRPRLGGARSRRSRERHGVPEDYLLWVGDLRHPDPHRRIPALVHAPRELPLVLVGAAGPWARELDGGVIVTGEVDDDELAALYTGAHALVLPSAEEGFGLPGGRGARLRHAGRRRRRPGAARGARRARDVRRPGRRRRASSPPRTPPRRPAPAPPAWTWADAAAATLGRLRAGARGAERRGRERARGSSSASAIGAARRARARTACASAGAASGLRCCEVGAVELARRRS